MKCRLFPMAAGHAWSSPLELSFVFNDARGFESAKIIKSAAPSEGGEGRQTELSINPTKRPRRSSVQSQIEMSREALPCACGSRVECMEPAAVRRLVEQNGNYRHGTRTDESIQGNEVRQLIVPLGAQVLRTVHVCRCLHLFT